MGSFVLCCLLSVIFLCGGVNSRAHSWRHFMTTDELENHISPEDLEEFYHMYQNKTLMDTNQNEHELENTTSKPIPDPVDCFGLGPLSRQIMKFFNMRPDDPEKVNTHFYFASRKNPNRVQVFPGDQFALEAVDFDANRRTVLIVHGFMSHSNASWVLDMTRAFLEWGDVNVIAVDWSGGGNTWKYWRAVANTRTVGNDIHSFLRQLMQRTGAKVKSFHFVGHSLGAHISSFASFLLGGVSRITGLDPAQPCFATSKDEERLDKSDADYVDVIHTNGRMLRKIGFGMPEPVGHADFYPNGGLKQPGCSNTSTSVWARMFSSTNLQESVCSHGRAYVLFTESLINGNCSFRAYPWDLSYTGVNSSLRTSCQANSCAEMGINAVRTINKRARGAYFLLTTDREPYCVPKNVTQLPSAELLSDIAHFEMMKSSSHRNIALSYPDPELYEERTFKENEGGKKEKSWWSKIIGWFG